MYDSIGDIYGYARRPQHTASTDHVGEGNVLYDEIVAWFDTAPFYLDQDDKLLLVGDYSLRGTPNPASSKIVCVNLYGDGVAVVG